eukprot:CAMPEP_0206546540 /NCGR_PEP_ID=MMETSP0325_2-20121206/12773_1 /ASSEMBLY_ACC=CAM_ASM_000347 /TAXON_ID=2866 /ORGANISM="Crypthecodinium cohnii, Strain Seligo" /LENGTH=142 /DNA_ID=CAMNT_0054045697 /DNA_START=492 /DNA_END=917 /DNA_ORIENTATION=-
MGIARVDHVWHQPHVIVWNDCQVDLLDLGSGASGRFYAELSHLLLHSGLQHAMHFRRSTGNTQTIPVLPAKALALARFLHVILPDKMISFSRGASPLVVHRIGVFQLLPKLWHLLGRYLAEVTSTEARDARGALEAFVAGCH